MADDGGWLGHMSDEDHRRFTVEAARVFSLHARVRSVGAAAVLEREVMEAEDTKQTRDYWRSLSAHYSELAQLHQGVAGATAAMAEILEHYSE